MKHLHEYRTMDKSEWGDGPWRDELDKIQYVDEDTGLPCLIKRNQMGALCGYVGVANTHPLYKVDYSDAWEKVDVHGELTYSDLCEEGDEAHSICHIPAPGEPDDVWWFGFDCGHSFDLAPAYESRMKDAMPGWEENKWRDQAYRTVEYVKRENAKLAAQLHALA